MLNQQKNKTIAETFPYNSAVWIPLEELMFVDIIPATILCLFSRAALSTMSTSRPVNRELWHSHVVIVETRLTVRDNINETNTTEL